MYGYIYKITIKNKESSKNNHFYIGQKKGDPKDSKWYYGSGIIIKEYCKKYSKYSSRKIRPCIAEQIGLTKEILTIANTKEELNQLEKEFIAQNKCELLLNLTEGGDGHPTAPWNKGLTKETDIRLLKVSESKKGANNPNYGKTPWNKGKKYSEEMRQKISQKTKEAMAKLPKEKKDAMKSKIGHKSKPHTEETKRRISESKKGTHWKLVNGKRIYY